IVQADMAESVPASAVAIVAGEPYAAWARVAALFHPLPPLRPGTHRSAVVAPDASIDTSAEIGPLAVIGAGAAVGPPCSIGWAPTAGSARMSRSVTRCWATGW